MMRMVSTTGKNPQLRRLGRSNCMKTGPRLGGRLTHQRARNAQPKTQKCRDPNAGQNRPRKAPNTEHHNQQKSENGQQYRRRSEMPRPYRRSGRP